MESAQAGQPQDRDNDRPQNFPAGIPSCWPLAGC
jgi:hypothetical protein